MKALVDRLIKLCLEKTHENKIEIINKQEILINEIKQILSITIEDPLWQNTEALERILQLQLRANNEIFEELKEQEKKLLEKFFRIEISGIVYDVHAVRRMRGLGTKGWHFTSPDDHAILLEGNVMPLLQGRGVPPTIVKATLEEPDHVLELERGRLAYIKEDVLAPEEIGAEYYDLKIITDKEGIVTTITLMRKKDTESQLRRFKQRAVQVA